MTAAAAHAMDCALTVVILNYNTAGLLRQCLQSLRAPQGVAFKTIVVDNASSDDSCAIVREEFPSVQLIASPSNIGFSAGNNLALPYLEGRYVLFLNADTEVFPGTFGEMVRFLDANPDAAIASCRVDLKRGGLDKDCHRGFPTPWAAFTHFTGMNKAFPRSALFNRYYLGHLDLGVPHEVDAVVGAFLVLRREAAAEVGFWDEDFFFYGEDLDLCYRYKQAGWKVMFNPACSIVHYKGASSGFRKESADVTQAKYETRLRIARESIRAMRLFYTKHYSRTYPRPVREAVFFGLRLLEWKRTRKYRRLAEKAAGR
ncbi:MAG: glycosyltransferase family 2 protein [Dehalococcoidia bacterium]